jgi:hypothetical protein
MVLLAACAGFAGNMAPQALLNGRPQLGAPAHALIRQFVAINAWYSAYAPLNRARHLGLVAPWHPGQACS